MSLPAPFQPGLLPSPTVNMVMLLGVVMANKMLLGCKLLSVSHWENISLIRETFFIIPDDKFITLSHEQDLF